MTETRWWRYTQRVIGSDTAQEAARRAGFDKSAFTRWKKGARADPDFVVKFARAYDVNVLEALVEAEFITDEEAALREVYPTPHEVLAEMRTSTLVQEVLRRTVEHEARQGQSFSGGTDDTRESFEAKILGLHDAGVTGALASEDDLARVRNRPRRRPVDHHVPPGVAARTLDGKSDGEKIDDEFAELGEESQDPGDTDPA